MQSEASKDIKDNGNIKRAAGDALISVPDRRMTKSTAILARAAVLAFV